MLKRPPTDTSNTINSFRKKRQQQGQLLMYGAIALVVLGLILLIYWLTRPEMPLGQYFATDTPTATMTSTPTNTATATLTSTITETPTVTLTVTPSEPFPYTIQEGDSLEALAQRFNLGPDGAQLIYFQNLALMEANSGFIRVGDTIEIPLPGAVLPTSTPIPPNLRPGTLVEHRVLPGETLAGIAFRFNSIAENIMEENGITDANSLQAGQILQIPVNLVTPTPTLPATSTPVSPTAPAGQATTTATSGATAAATSASGGTANAACSFEENPQYVTQLETLINDARTEAGLPALTVHAQLTEAAEAHASDMLCNDYFSPMGLDGSTPEERVEAAGFNASEVTENLFALHPAFGGNPQAAVDWWMGNPNARADLLNENTTVMGIAYASSEDSLFGGYFVVVAASP
jgi:uncharacterized protein YkwD